MNSNNLSVRELFGFERDPFVAHPAAIWLDDQRRDAIDQLTGLVSRGGFAVLTGPAGCGKTILLGHLCAQLGTTTRPQERMSSSRNLAFPVFGLFRRRWRGDEGVECLWQLN